MLLPEVSGVRFNGKNKEGVTIFDLVLRVTQMLRKRGVVGRFIEYFGTAPLKEVKSGFAQYMDKEFGKVAEMDKRVPVEGRKHTLGHGDVVIAAITSCTNTSNPNVVIAAGLLARKAAPTG